MLQRRKAGGAQRALSTPALSVVSFVGYLYSDKRRIIYLINGYVLMFYDILFKKEFDCRVLVVNRKYKLCVMSLEIRI